jgi:hypothetical protein
VSEEGGDMRNTRRWLLGVAAVSILGVAMLVAGPAGAVDVCDYWDDYYDDGYYAPIGPANVYASFWNSDDQYFAVRRHPPPGGGSITYSQYRFDGSWEFFNGTFDVWRVTEIHNVSGLNSRYFAIQHNSYSNNCWP